MSTLPRISVVTPSYNQGRFIAETIESVLEQGYPNLEHIVVDAMSSDETAQVLDRYGHLRVIREPDRGMGDALNKGFRAATGDIFCFLNSDDTLLAGALEAVAREMGGPGGPKVVMGRCRFVDEQGRYFGVEHPSHFASFRRVLEVWKGHWIPQPAVFWAAEVWRQCGQAEAALAHVDYDLFCRFARHYPFHKIDRVLCTYRLHTESKTMGWTEAERLEDAIRLSRRYWGSPWLPFYWRLALSLGWYRLDRTGWARRHYQRAEELRRQGRELARLPHWLAAGVLAPDVAFYMAVYPHLRRTLGGALLRVLRFRDDRRGAFPQTAVYLDRAELWEDGWAGPRLVVERASAGGEKTLRLRGLAHTRYLDGPLTLTVAVDGVRLGEAHVEQDGAFQRDFTWAAGAVAGRHRIEILASPYLVYHRFQRNRDYRPLTWRPAGGRRDRVREGGLRADDAAGARLHWESPWNQATSQ